MLLRRRLPRSSNLNNNALADIKAEERAQHQLVVNQRNSFKNALADIKAEEHAQHQPRTK